MNFYSEYTSHNCPKDSPEYTQNILEIEKAAEKALSNISLIYNEIMTPKDCDSEELEISSDDPDKNAFYYDGQSHYLKTCCSTLRELCVKCDRFISRCTSCNRCKCSGSNNNLKKVRNDENSDNVYRPASAQESTYKLKCTIPKPFSLYTKSLEHQKAKEYKISKMKEDLEKEIEEELKIRTSCKPVPKSTHLPLYNQMVQEKEINKVKRKERCLEILNNTKPFNLHSSSKSSMKSTTDATSDNINFKATPVPKHILSSKVSEKLKNKEKIRKIIRNERAKQAIEQSSLPFSQKTITYSRSLIDLINLNKAQNKESKPRNTSEITERLYMKKCNETIDNWNKKVLQVDMNKKMVNQENCNLLNEYMPIHKKQLTELPFMYFPVRMSNAAILREKRIRAEITARKEREKRKKMEEELAKKKINSEILHKLKDLIPSSEGEKEIDEKVKSFRESQIRRKQEYEKELEDIMKRVSEQHLLLERQSKVKKVISSECSYSDKESEVDDNDAQESVATSSNSDSSTES